MSTACFICPPRYPDREMPDAFERTAREIFPDDHPGSFVQLDDGRWIRATFSHFPRDFDDANPAVFDAVAAGTRGRRRSGACG